MTSVGVADTNGPAEEDWETLDELKPTVDIDTALKNLGNVKKNNEQRHTV
jgi:hypothetical protein